MRAFQRRLAMAIATAPIALTSCKTKSKEPTEQHPRGSDAGSAASPVIQPSGLVVRGGPDVPSPPPPVVAPVKVVPGPRTSTHGQLYIGVPPNAKSFADLPRGVHQSGALYYSDCALGGTWCAPLGDGVLATGGVRGSGTDGRGCPGSRATIPSPFGGGDVGVAGGSTPVLHTGDPSLANMCCYGWAVACKGGVSSEGRALMDDDARIVAALIADESIVPDAWVASLPSDMRHVLAHHWARIALDEHASIASFARATLEMMTLGAPSGMIAAMQRAAGDEVRHARDAFRLASGYAGRTLSPGALPTLGPRSHGVVDAAIETFVEGCVGETLAAARAGLAARVAEPVPVKAVLRRIARDETRHAALAWETLAWLCETSPAVRRAVAERAAELPRSWAVQPPTELDAQLAAHGMLARHEVVALERRVWLDVIEPTLLEIVDQPRRGYWPGAVQLPSTV